MKYYFRPPINKIKIKACSVFTIFSHVSFLSLLASFSSMNCNAQIRSFFLSRIHLDSSCSDTNFAHCEYRKYYYTNLQNEDASLEHQHYNRFLFFSVAVQSQVSISTSTPSQIKISNQKQKLICLLFNWKISWMKNQTKK